MEGMQMDIEKLYEEAAAAIVDADEDEALDIVERAEAGGVDMAELLQKGFSAGMREIGDMFGRGEAFLPEMIFSAEIMKRIVAEIEEKLGGAATLKRGKIVLGTVKGDVHDIGKGIVASLLKTNGVEVIDVGREVAAETFVDTAEEVGADFIGSSALLTTTMGEQEKIENILRERGLAGKYKTLVGGAPVTQHWADKIGATAYCEDAAVAVKYISSLYE
jgi:trimethylamine corrinoid protein